MTKKKAPTADVLRQLGKGVLKRYEAAELLDCSERQVNRLMRQYGVTRPASPIHDAREASAKRRADRITVAQKVVDGKFSPEEGAKQADVSVRTLYRYMAKLKKTSKNSAKAAKKRRK
jgi:hypothetical protein